MAHSDFDIGIVRESGADAYNSTTATGVTMDTEVRGDNDYAKATSDAGLTAGVGHHLLLYNVSMEATDSVTNQRRERQGRITQDGTQLDGYYGASSFYVRRGTAGENFGSLNAGTIVEVTTGTDDFQVTAQRTDSSTTGLVSTEANKSGLMMIKLPDADPICRTRGASTQAMSATSETYTDLTLSTNDDMETGFSRSGNVITLASTGKYFVTYSVKFTTPSDVRTGVGARCTLNGTSTVIDGSQSYNYGRTTTSCTDPVCSGAFIMNANANDTIRVRGAGVKQQGSINCSSEGVSIAIWYMGSGGEFIRLGHDTNIDCTTTETAMVWADNDEVDTASFTHTGGSGTITLVETDDYLMLGQMQTSRSSGDAENDRENCRFRWTVAGSNQTYGGGACFMRGDGGADRCDSGSQMMWWGGAATATNALTLTHDAVAGTTTDQYDATYVGLQGVRLSTLAAAGGETISIPKASLTLTEKDYTFTNQQIGATWDEALNTAHASNVTSGDDNTRLRAQIRNDGLGAPAAQDLKWQFNYSGDAGWTDLTSTSTYLKTFNSSNYANGDDAAVKLLGGAEDFLADNNAAVDAGAADATFTMGETFVVGDVIESEVALTVVSADVADSTTITLRLVELRDGSTEVPTTLTNTPTINITKTGGDENISVPKASLTLTPQTPTVATTNRIAVGIPKVSLTLSELDPAVRTNNGIPVPKASLTLTELDPSLTTNEGIAVPKASLTLTELDPALRLNEGVAIPKASLTLTELDPSVRLRINVLVPLATLTLTEKDPALSANEGVPIPKASLTLTEKDPEVNFGETVEIPKASLTLVEQDPALRTNEGVSVPKASLDLTANAPDPNVTENVEIPKASLVLNEFDPEVSIRINVSIPKAPLTLTEKDPALRTNEGISVPKASLTLTELDPVASVNESVEIPKVSLTLTEQDPAVQLEKIIGVPKASLTLTELDPVVRTNEGISVPKASLTLTEQGPAVVLTERIAVGIPKASLTLTEFDPASVITQNIQVPKGSITLTELDPVLRTNDGIAVPKASLTLTELDPVASVNENVEIPKASLTLTEKDPEANFNENVEIPAASLTLTEKDPVLRRNEGVAVPKADLSLSVQTPAIRTNEGISVPLASLSLTEQTPKRIISENVEVPKASLTLTEKDPVLRRNEGISIPLATISLTIAAPTVRFNEGISVPLAVASLVQKAPVCIAPASWDEVPTADTEVWSEVATSDNQTWSGVSTSDSETWTEVATADTEIWTEVTTSDDQDWDHLNR